MARHKKRGHAIALFSGGLDSALAILLILRQNIEVTALTFMTHFGCDLGDRSSCGSNPYPAAEKFGFNVKLMHLGQKFVDIVENPKFGRGAHMNVCIDCRILMLNEARAYMDMVGADFIITGEVVGQRPFSQVKDKIHLVARESRLKGKLLRPLSAKLLPPTEAETAGLVDREQLEAIQGRGRKRQIELAREFGLEDYPSPAGGCLLTDAGYSKRLVDLMAHRDRLVFDDLNLLQVGRHFRLSEDTKLVVGRNKQENEKIQSYLQPHHYLLEVLDAGSPLTLLIGEGSEEHLTLAARITARYCSAKDKPSVKVTCTGAERTVELSVAPMSDKELEPLAIR